MDLAEKQRKIAEINRKISNYKKLKVQAEEKIDDLNKKIKELNSTLDKFNNVKTSINVAHDDGMNILKGLKSSVSRPSAVLKDTFFSTYRDAIDGTKYKNALNGVLSSIRKTSKKIDDFNEAINNQNKKIDNYNYQIKILINQKRTIESMTTV